MNRMEQRDEFKTVRVIACLDEKLILDPEKIVNSDLHYYSRILENTSKRNNFVFSGLNSKINEI